MYMFIIILYIVSMKSAPLVFTDEVDICAGLILLLVQNLLFRVPKVVETSRLIFRCHLLLLYSTMLCIPTTKKYGLCVWTCFVVNPVRVSVCFTMYDEKIVIVICTECYLFIYLAVSFKYNCSLFKAGLLLWYAKHPPL